MSNWDKERLLRSTILAGFFAAGLAATPAMAQQSDDPVTTEEEEEAEESGDRIVVTGSRIRRDEFSSVKPVQIISGEISREIGLFDATEIIQESTVSSARQVDQTFAASGFLASNGARNFAGPGVTSSNLRGLGATRTLNLVNGRRIGPSGTEGAPSVPDLSLIPSSMIERVDLLLDGASSVYGSDAVAGVVNVILRTDYDGFEVEFSGTAPEQSGGENMFASARWGVNAERGFIGFAAEYSSQENLRLDGRDYFKPCNTSVEIDNQGNVRRLPRTAFEIDNVGSFAPGTPQFDFNCPFAFGVNRINVTALPGESSNFIWNSLYYTPGRNTLGAFSTTGIPNFGEYDFLGQGIFDIDGDGQPDLNPLDPFYQNTADEYLLSADLVPETETMNLFANGEYNIGGLFNVTAFFEGGFNNRQSRIRDAAVDALFLDVAATNPFNPCNPNTPASSPIQGVDCGLVQDELTRFFFGQPLSFFGLPDPVLGARPVGTQLRIGLEDEDRVTTAESTNMRLVGGFTGTVPDPDFLPVSNISWEFSASYDRSKGETRRPGWNEQALALTAATTIEDPNNPGQFICGIDGDGDGIPNSQEPIGLNTGSALTPECVAVNFFAPSLFTTDGRTVGSFATQEEYDFLRAYRDFSTTVEQTLVQGFVSADLFDLPAGTVAGVIGFEYREDSITSNPADTTSDGNLLGFFRDFGANGTRDLYEAFYEVEVPLIAGQPFIEELTINHSGRFTEESNFGSAYTYSLSGIYRPNDWLTFRSSYGTSYRAPNLEEQFALGVSAFTTFSDPCVPSELFFEPSDPTAPFSPLVYNSALDTREPATLANCRLNGVDPTSADLAGGNASYSTEIFTVGNDVLQEETSTSFNVGFAVEQPWINDIDIRFSMNYYDIEVEDTLVTTSLGFVSGECFGDDQTDLDGDGFPDAGATPNAFCSLLTRGAPDGSLTAADLPFTNQDAETAIGVDYNLFIQRDWLAFGRELTTGLDLRANNTLERDSVIRLPDGTINIDNNEGFQFFPHWNGTFRAFADYGDWRLTWNTRWIGKTDDNQFAEAPVQIFDAAGNVINTTTSCPGPQDFDTNGVPVDLGLTCVDLETVDDHFTHDVSVRYSQDTWTLVAGVSNVLNEEPQEVDSGENSTLGSTGRFAGHDFLGRRFFVNVRRSF